tara:strand:+ start:15995 stop:17146 length:1152 start_codon:yes stop_codon:yes gene_type:complete
MILEQRKILIVCSLTESLRNFRKDLISAFLDHGLNVYTASPNSNPEIFEELTKMGVIPLQYHLQRNGLNPLKDLISIWDIKKIVNTHDIDLIFPYTIKPVIYGSIAGRITGKPTISLITGLGLTFSQASKKAQILQHFTEVLYRLAIRKNKAIIFQNTDDLELFRQKGLISENQIAHVVDGSGINLEKYPFRINNNTTKRKIFVLVARLIKEKGVELFIEAAKVLKPKFPDAEFHIIGEPVLSVSSIRIEELEELHRHNIVVYHGFQKNIAKFLNSSDVFVLPSYYREGIPRSILEALSVGMPIITTDTPGCRETIILDQNGILIEPKLLDPLIDAINFFLDNPDKIKPMGIRSRKLAEDRFRVEIINKKIMNIIKNKDIWEL